MFGIFKSHKNKMNSENNQKALARKLAIARYIVKHSDVNANKLEVTTRTSSIEGTGKIKKSSEINEFSFEIYQPEDKTKNEVITIRLKNSNPKKDEKLCF